MQLPVEADLSELRAPIQLQSGGERSAEGTGGGEVRSPLRSLSERKLRLPQDGTSILRRLERSHPTHLDLHLLITSPLDSEHP